MLPESRIKMRISWNENVKDISVFTYGCIYNAVPMLFLEAGC